MKKILLICAAVFGAVVFVNIASNLAPHSPDSRAESSPTRKPPASQPWKVMAGNGTHQMGGMDGKNWGVWIATPPTVCEWSIRAVRTYAAGEVLSEGTAEPGVPVRVNIQADGKVSAMSGLIDDDHRIVFMTSGCGQWEFVG